MNTVQPIRDEEALRRCFEIAREHDSSRGKNEVSWELLLAVGFSTSLRISDISRLRVRDIVGTERVQVKAKKTESGIWLSMRACACCAVSRRMRSSSSPANATLRRAAFGPLRGSAPIRSSTGLPGRRAYGTGSGATR